MLHGLISVTKKGKKKKTCLYWVSDLYLLGSFGPVEESIFMGANNRKPHKFALIVHDSWIIHQFYFIILKFC